MSRKKKDTDYVAISARLHALENRMLTKERMEQLLEAREDAEVGKIMADCGYAEPQPLTLANLEESLALAQRDLFADLGKSLEGEEALLDVFRIKHDYHNAKAILKAQARGQDPARLLVSGVQLLCIGILGQYLSRTYMESKHRPIFIVKESNTEEADR